MRSLRRMLAAAIGISIASTPASYAQQVGRDADSYGPFFAIVDRKPCDYTPQEMQKMGRELMDYLKSRRLGGETPDPVAVLEARRVQACKIVTDSPVADFTAMFHAFATAGDCPSLDREGYKERFDRVKRSADSYRAYVELSTALRDRQEPDRTCIFRRAEAFLATGDPFGTMVQH